MSTPFLWLLALGPLLLAALGALPAGAGRDPRTTSDRALLAGAANVAAAIAAILLLVVAGPMATPTLGVAGIGFSLSLDALSATLLLLVALVGTVVIRYARNYLAGDPGHERFMRLLALALSAVLLLVLSGNLFQLLLAWSATSIALGRLLLFYAGRTGAVLAARKKYVVSRVGDLCLIVAILLIYSLFGSLDIAALSAGATALAAAGDVPASAHAAALLLVAAAVLKSAQFPVHGWLLEVMETPTPVSALLHAGIINAGGFLLLRLADLIALSGPALDGLIVVGGLTAMFGSVVMLTQTSVKVSLAYSTIAQMGFMILQCGLGAWSAALLHIVAHSLYKAHAFLSSGSVVERIRAAGGPAPEVPPHPARVALAATVVLSTGLVAATLFSSWIAAQPGVFALGAVLVLGLVQLVVGLLDQRPAPAVVGRAVVLAVGVIGAYVVLQAAAALVTAGVLPPAAPLRGGFELAVILLVVLGFAAITLLQIMLPFHAGEPRWQALYAHVSNGFYVNTVANRLAIRLWPAPAPGTPVVKES